MAVRPAISSVPKYGLNKKVQFFSRVGFQGYYRAEYKSFL